MDRQGIQTAECRQDTEREIYGFACEKNKNFPKRTSKYKSFGKGNGFLEIIIKIFWKSPFFLSNLQV
jgi:hypothetical protein